MCWFCADAGVDVMAIDATATAPMHSARRSDFVVLLMIVSVRLLVRRASIRAVALQITRPTLPRQPLSPTHRLPARAPPFLIAAHREVAWAVSLVIADPLTAGRAYR